MKKIGNKKNKHKTLVTIAIFFVLILIISATSLVINADNIRAEKERIKTFGKDTDFFLKQHGIPAPYKEDLTNRIPQIWRRIK